MLARILDLIFVSRSQPAPSCGLDDCSLACFTEPTGKRRDFCSLAHAHLYKAKHGRYPGRPAQSAIQISGNDSISTRDGPFDPTRDYVFPNIVLFWQPPSPFSQWTRSVFQVEEVWYTCAEQYMMAEKAKVFGDETSRLEIMKTDSPKAQKKLGRGVRGFDCQKWNQHKKKIVTRGTYEKFSQNPVLRRRLLETGDKILAEASPLDTVWGIGLRADDSQALKRSTWRGQNLLGEVLEEVRNRIRRETS